MFYQKVDLKNKVAMTKFLENHFMYHTMNSWNQSRSFANNMKIHKLDLPGEIIDTAYSLLDVPESYDEINTLIKAFSAKYDYLWQTGFNGRSGGYLVLYQGGIKDSGYKSHCRDCGQLRYKTIEESGERCGRCGSNSCVNLMKPIMQTYTYPGKGIDLDDYIDDPFSIRDLTKVVIDFDKLCDDIREHWIYLCRTYEVATEKIYIPETVNVLKKIV